VGIFFFLLPNMVSLVSNGRWVRVALLLR
jgi:hypothetical protein